MASLNRTKVDQVPSKALRRKRVPSSAKAALQSLVHMGLWVGTQVVPSWFPRGSLNGNLGT